MAACEAQKRTNDTQDTAMHHESVRKQLVAYTAAAMEKGANIAALEAKMQLIAHSHDENQMALQELVAAYETRQR